jgi:hypothetical protein
MIHIQIRQEATGLSLDTRNRGLAFTSLQLEQALRRLEHPRYQIRRLTDNQMGSASDVHVFVKQNPLMLSLLDGLFFYPIGIWIALLGIFIFYQESATLFANQSFPVIFTRSYHEQLLALSPWFQPSYAMGVAVYVYVFGIVFTGISLIGFILAFFLLGHLPTQVIRFIVGPLREG